MKTAREELKTSTRVSVAYTCSRCGAPCGQDEPKEATISMDTSKSLRIHVDGGGIVGAISARVKITSEQGNTYPEATNANSYVVDACVKCFHEVALPALLAAGFQVREEETDY